MSADGSNQPASASREDREFILHAVELRNMLTYKAIARRLGLSPRQVRTVLEMERRRRAKSG